MTVATQFVTIGVGFLLGWKWAQAVKTAATVVCMTVATQFVTIGVGFLLGCKLGAGG